MIEMHLDATPAAGHLSFDSIGVLPNQKSGQTGNGFFLGEKSVFGRPPIRQLQQLAIVTNIHIQIELVKTHGDLGFSPDEIQAGGRLDKLRLAPRSSA